MSNLGFGVMLNYLAGNKQSIETLQKMLNQKILNVEMVNDALIFTFKDFNVKVWDDGQSCCESRYMMTDDNLKHFKNSKFLGMELRDGPTTESDYEIHETQFLLINTSKGTFTMVTHDEHNGYYGGFYIKLEEL